MQPHFSMPPSLLRAHAPAVALLTSPFFTPLHPSLFAPTLDTSRSETRLCHPISLLPVSLCSVFSYASHLFICRSLTPTTPRWAPSQYQRNGNALGATHSVNRQSKKVSLFAQRSHDVPSESAPRMRLSTRDIVTLRGSIYF